MRLYGQGAPERASPSSAGLVTVLPLLPKACSMIEHLTRLTPFINALAKLTMSGAALIGALYAAGLL